MDVINGPPPIIAGVEQNFLVQKRKKAPYPCYFGLYGMFVETSNVVRASNTSVAISLERTFFAASGANRCARSNHYSILILRNSPGSVSEPIR
jgi:NADH:ubiquinone oxidoreductase subunit F (NADH-binding)